ncbi:Protein of unknown function [Ruegeria halocynthiae]|uniref:DUF3726 domain-containing protein n=1 Tax=Ruegeria halocynthiae TaxID=985054 RepID=A0A1H3CLY7_9RHOB|nr:DUF3726 domain-containing protein [Ruegeria halocynthiae]SDX54928.1 Protein of unknown function [Ruegeria halocynthiae]
MNFSLNEIEATAKRATRGAGYAWGIAEDAAKATRWLCSQGVDGVVELARVLEREFTGSLDDHVPAGLYCDWDGGKDLCPLTVGVLLSDCSHMLLTGPFRIRQVASPMMLLPFAAHAARSQNVVAIVTTGDFSAATDGARLALRNDCPDWADHVEVALGDILTEPCSPQTRATPDPIAWKILNRIAHRTYAPATEESRLLGAGAGLSDND